MWLAAYAPPVRTHALTAAVSAAVLALTPLAVLGAGAPAASAAPARAIDYTAWGTKADFARGTSVRVGVAAGKLRITAPTPAARKVRVAGTTWDRGVWTSPWRSPGFTLTELVPSWEAATPEGTFVDVQVRGRTAQGTVGSWDTLARWAGIDTTVKRASFGSQGDDVARVNVDTVVAQGAVTAWQVRVLLHREAGTTRSPRVDAVGAMSSRLPAVSAVRTSRPGVARGVVLDVPRFSQMTHSGHLPQYGGGGQAWCSPTSLAMVLGYYRALPSRTETAWVGAHGDRVVDHLARRTYDHRYRGTGNWSFNTAEAATRTQQAFVTRFRSLVGVERFVKAGIPVITSLSFGRGQLSGAPISSTDGHLMVVVGFTASGAVVVNDPAASSKAGVRRTYSRAQFENAWLKRGTSAGGSGGLAYIVRDAAHPLPARDGARNW